MAPNPLSTCPAALPVGALQLMVRPVGTRLQRRAVGVAFLAA
jgi:hypothetical protein